MENAILNLPCYSCEMINISTEKCKVEENKNPLDFNPFKCRFFLLIKENHFLFNIESSIYYRNSDKPNKWYLYKSKGKYSITPFDLYSEFDVKSICVQVVYQHIVRHSHCIYVDYNLKINMFDFNRLYMKININSIKEYLDNVNIYLSDSYFDSKEFSI